TPGMLQNTRRSAAISEKLSAVLVRSQRQAEAIPKQLDYVVTAKSIKPEPRHVQDTIGGQIHLGAVDNRPVHLLAILHFHAGPVRQERPQRDRAPGSVTL